MESIKRTCSSCLNDFPIEFFKQWNSRCCLNCDPRIHNPERYKKRKPRKKKIKFVPVPGTIQISKSERSKIKRIKKKRKKNIFLEKFWSKSLAKMPYKEFLETEYWKNLRNHKRNLVGNKCELCGNTEHLQCHHLHYLLRGNEHKDLSCLKVLCGDCHQKEHGLNAK